MDSQLLNIQFTMENLPIWFYIIQVLGSASEKRWMVMQNENFQTACLPSTECRTGQCDFLPRIVLLSWLSIIQLRCR